MSEPKLISPLLDGFAMGAPISSHHGVRCCPAMKQNTEDKYIIKIISLPASQVQLDALLLTGAYKDPGEAMDYFKSQADDIEKEAAFLQTVSKLEGFLPYEGWQIIPMEDNSLGYQVYLLGTYKRSLERHIRRNGTAPIDPIKLGLDICNALSVCRRAGFLYAALKPTNIFLSEDGEYRIGDLGFIPLESLKYSSLPGKYKSRYCSPEILDPLKTLNETVDTYALGMILLQICCGGKLPELQEGAPLPLPEETPNTLAKIIEKAIAPDLEERWSDPAEMGKALAACMNSDTPDKQNEPSVSDHTQVFSTEAVSSQAAVSMSDTRIVPTCIPAGNSSDEKPLTGVSSDTKIMSPVQVQAPISSETKVMPVAQIKEAVTAETKVLRTVTPQTSGVKPQKPDAETKILPKTGDAVSEISEPTSRIPVAVKNVEAPTEYDYEDDLDDEEETFSQDEIPHGVRKPIGKGWILPVVLILVLGLLGFGAFYYYQNYYLQTIESMTINGKYDSFTVNVVTQIDESLLTVSCTDTYGNSMSKGIVNGEAEFTDLLPNSQYKVTLEIEGFHQLVGKTSDVYNTESKTEIVSFTGITGPEDGSVMFTFTVDGPEPERWILSYSAEGEETLSHEFAGHNVTIKDLVVPKTYTFTLSPSEDIYVDGETSVTFTASALIMAQNLTITSCEGTDMTVRWDTPEGAEVSMWTVRCYSDGGYEKTLETTENKAVFSNIDSTSAYYVEVTANGMTQSARTGITANPITITSVRVDETDMMKLTVTWDHKGTSPDGGWLLMYSLDGSATQSIVKCAGTTAEIPIRYPGSEYKFVIQAADSTSIFSNVHTYSCPQAPAYDEHSFNAAKAVANLVVTPEKENWTSADVSKNDYTDTFSVGQKISIVLYCPVRFYIPTDEISILYVIRNSEGQVMTNLTSQAMDDWHDMWVSYNTSYAELDLPTVPTELGNYTLSIFFNGKAVTSTNFAIVE